MLILNQTLDYAYLAIGFGLVIFFHELGHFLAAKYSDVKVEQFAVGFGPAMVAWRKGIGFRPRTTTPDYDKLIGQAFDAEQKNEVHTKERVGPSQEQSDVIAKKLGLGETEYRINWIPLGGYVKMLGQDDMRPGMTAEDPRAYNNKSIRSRMLIVSAGVIMNVILACIGFMIVYLVGYPVPPARVGGVISLSPAMQTVDNQGNRVPLQPGDEILSCDGKSTIGDFSKIQLRVALAEEGETMPIVVRHLDGTEQTLYAKPIRARDDEHGLLMLGILPPIQLSGMEPRFAKEDWDPEKLKKTDMPDVQIVQPGDVITQINGQNVDVNEFWKLDQALAASNGKPVELTVKSLDGSVSQHDLTPHILAPLGKQDLAFAGMVPRAMITMIQDDSPSLGKLKPGDVIVNLEGGGDALSNPAPAQLPTALSANGQKDLPVTLTVLSLGDTKPHQVEPMIPNIRIGGGRIGLGIGIGYDEYHLVVAQTIADSPTHGKIPDGATLTAINGQPVDNWFEVQRILANAKPDDSLAISYLAPADGKLTVANIKLSPDEISSAQMISFTSDLELRAMPGTLKTPNPLTAIKWGVLETRDSILDLYVTLLRMLQGNVSVSNMMGPVGMFHAGAQLADRGMMWLLWFLANISANLAVVNFLPLPIVDGGLFVMLILEKIQGKPLSPDTQRIVQIAGLALFLGVFLLVTYQDIARIAGFAN
jgi:regulator of sigma E protease